ncbi:MAG: OmpA family protein [Saprospiraceae bacterium]
MKNLLACLLIGGVLLAGCKTMNKSQKGAVIGAGSGAVIGGAIGKASGNTAMGAILGATVGGVTGAVIGRNMDKQAAAMKKSVPDAKVERVGEGIVVEFNEKVLFGFDKSVLNADAKRSLDKMVTVLNDYPDTNIEVQGHTDSKGTDAYNEKLSRRRADAVVSYLRSKSISSSRLTTKAYGESAPKYSNDSEDGAAQNRRVEFLVYANEKMKAEARKESGGK